MRVKQNNVTVEELLEDGSPYKLWYADLWACAACGVEIITGFGRLPVAEHGHPMYDDAHRALSQGGRIYPGRCRER